MNPGSRSGKGKLHWNILTQRLSSGAIDFDVQETQSLRHGLELARDAAENYAAIVAVGGDGTINAVADGILQSPYPARAMGVLYTGTSPDFCRYHHIPITPELAVDALIVLDRQADV